MGWQIGTVQMRNTPSKECRILFIFFPIYITILILMDEDAREVKSMCEVADRLKNQGRNEERKSILNTITKKLMEREGITRKEARARAEAFIK